MGGNYIMYLDEEYQSAKPKLLDDKGLIGLLYRGAISKSREIVILSEIYSVHPAIMSRFLQERGYNDKYTNHYMNIFY